MLLGDILELNALKEPDRPALVVDERTFTYGELCERARRLAVALGGLAAPGERVAILSENTVEYVDAYYGVPMARMALVFLNYRLNPHELAWITDDAGAKVLIVERSYLQAMLDVRDEFPGRRAHHRRGRRPRRRAGRRRLRRAGGLVERVDAPSVGPTRTTSRGSSTRAVPPASRRAPCSRTGASSPPSTTRSMSYDVKARRPLAHVLPDVPRRRLPRSRSTTSWARQVVLMRAYSPDLFLELVDKHQHHVERAGADDDELPPPAPEDRRVRPVDAAQHRLRRRRHARRGARRPPSTASAPSCGRASA